jgi:hypothetical protein
MVGLVGWGNTNFFTGTSHIRRPDFSKPATMELLRRKKRALELLQIQSTLP